MQVLNTSFLFRSGTYVLRFDAVNQEIEQAKIEGRVDPKTGVEIIIPQASEAQSLTLDERAVALATAISSESRMRFAQTQIDT